MDTQSTVEWQTYFTPTDDPRVLAVVDRDTDAKSSDGCGDTFKAGYAVNPKRLTADEPINIDDFVVVIERSGYCSSEDAEARAFELSRIAELAFSRTSPVLGLRRPVD